MGHPLAIWFYRYFPWIVESIKKVVGGFKILFRLNALNEQLIVVEEQITEIKGNVEDLKLDVTEDLGKVSQKITEIDANVHLLTGMVSSKYHSNQGSDNGPDH